jgi:hypothetical protein
LCLLLLSWQGKSIEVRPVDGLPSELTVRQMLGRQHWQSHSMQLGILFMS